MKPRRVELQIHVADREQVMLMLIVGDVACVPGMEA